LSFSFTTITVAHFASFFRSHLAQVMVPLRVTSLSSFLSSFFSSAACTTTTRAKPISTDNSVLMTEPPLRKRRHGGAWPPWPALRSRLRVSGEKYTGRPPRPQQGLL